MKNFEIFKRAIRSMMRDENDMKAFINKFYETQDNADYYLADTTSAKDMVLMCETTPIEIVNYIVQNPKTKYVIFNVYDNEVEYVENIEDKFNECLRDLVENIAFLEDIDEE